MSKNLAEQVSKIIASSLSTISGGSGGSSEGSIAGESSSSSIVPMSADQLAHLACGLKTLQGFQGIQGKLPAMFKALLQDYSPQDIIKLLALLTKPDGGRKCLDEALQTGISLQNIDRMSMPAKPAYSVFEAAKTGDILLVSGLGAFSALIRKGTQSPYSHCGILVRDPSDMLWSKFGKLRDGTPVPRDRGLYLLDSDFEEDGSVDGVVLRPLEVQLRAYMEEDYHGPEVDVAVRSLVLNDETQRDSMRHELELTALEFAGRRYTSQDAKADPLHFLSLAFSICDANQESDCDRFFCSELVAVSYQRLGLLPLASAGGKLCTNYVPQDFATPHGRARAKVATDINDVLLRNARLEPECRIDLSELLKHSDPWLPQRRSAPEAAAGDADAASTKTDQENEGGKATGSRLCKDHCGHPAFREYATCCVRCRGANGPHSSGCVLSAAPTCKNGCGGVPFEGFQTCCSHCKGESGPHARDCSDKVGLA